MTDSMPLPKVTLEINRSGDGSAFHLYQLKVSQELKVAEQGENQEAEPGVDVVLVHGLTGDAVKTWGGTIDKQGVLGGDCWPRDLVLDPKHCATFWTMGADFPALKSKMPTSQIGFSDDARSALGELVAKLGQKDRPIIFVAHSLGGLLVKAILKAASDSTDPSQRHILRRTYAVLFVGTPHSGSRLAGLRHLIPWLVKAATWGLGKALLLLLGTIFGVGIISFPLANLTLPSGTTWQIALPTLVTLAFSGALLFLLRESRYVTMLSLDNPELHELTHSYRRLVASYPFFTESFFEDKPLWGVCIVVPRHSADPGVTECTSEPIAADHIKMCKGASATRIQERIRYHIESAGGHRAVFEETLKMILGPDLGRDPLRHMMTRCEDGTEHFVEMFESIASSERSKAENRLRQELRHAIGKELRPSKAELGRALKSSFDIDKFVWQIWNEERLAELIRNLTTMATTECESWDKRFGRQEKPSLFPFYRPLRTIAHGLLLDSGDNRKNLRQLIVDAERKLNAKELDNLHDRPDGDCRARWLLLELHCLLDVGETVEGFLQRWERKFPKHQFHPGGGAELAMEKEKFDSSLKNLRRALAS